MLAARSFARLLVCASILFAASAGAQVSALGAGHRGKSPVLDNAIVTTGSGQLRLDGLFEPLSANLAHDDPVYQSIGPGSHSATYVPNVDRQGYYELFLWWPEGIAGAGQVDVLIHHASGTAQVAIDQRVLSGQWNSLGIYKLHRGAGAIQLVPRQGTSLVVDAMRLELISANAPALAVPDPEIPILAVNSPFTANLKAIGGSAPYSWSILQGALPAGVSLDPVNGILAGNPLAAGHFELTLRVTDANGAIVDEPLSLDVVESIPEEPAAKAEMMRAKSGSNGPPEMMPAKSGSGAPDLSALIGILAAMPEGQWAMVNLNKYSDVWAPADLRPLKALSNPTPGVIILAWSSFAWDDNRGDLWLYGGGHANYPGNDVYRWHGTTRLWERASLPSEIKQDDLGNWNAIDGADNAPASAHTYDNNIFFPLIDRLVVFGGAAYNNGGPYLREATPTTSRKTGPYLFDPNRADGNKVGGTTGSQVMRVSPHPEVVGGEMWQNRDMWINISGPLPATHINGCTAYVQENGRDVAYVGANSGSTALALYRFSISDVDDPTTDSWTQMGRYWNAGSDQPACGYDPVRKLFVRTCFTGGNPFAYWNLNTPGPTNNDQLVMPTDPTGEFPQLLANGTIKPRMCGLDFDPVRNQFALWCGDGRVWMLQPPQPPVTPAGWTIVKQPTPTSSVPDGDLGTGIIGKWKYISGLDAFMGLQDAVEGNIWIYKPVGWHNPGNGIVNASPTISITSPKSGAVIPAGQPIDILTSTGDSDGFVAKVEFFNGATKIGESLAQPFSFHWASPPPGPATLTALATDNGGAQTVSNAVPISIQAANSGTFVLQDGTNGYASTRDTYLSIYHTTMNFGAQATEISQRDYYTDLFRFAIFASEGGPVPEGAIIQSATLALYKAGSYDAVFNLYRMLQDWSESAATWNQRLQGVAWGAPGAMAADVDYGSTPDAQASIAWNPGWLQFDVTAAVQQFSSGQPNYGWRLRGISGNIANGKSFNTREFASDPTLRPKLTIQYYLP